MEIILWCNLAIGQQDSISNENEGETYDEGFGKHIKAGPADPC